MAQDDSTKRPTNLVTAPLQGSTGFSMASLYVGDLHQDVTEAMLFDKFASAGPIISIRVCRDMITRRSLGYAYINFQQPADAERALDTMNFDMLRGRSLRIMWSQRDPALRKSGVGNVFIKNLDKNIDTKSLYDTFSAFGNILSCKIMTDENGQSKGFGFVHFETQESANQAIAKVNGMLLADKKVFVGPFMPHTQRVGIVGIRKFTNVYVKNFDDQLDDEKFKEMFGVYGTILSCKIARDEVNGQSKGFGFCSFEKPEQAEAAVQGLNGTPIGDKKLFVGRFQTKNERAQEVRRKKEQLRQERMNKSQGVNLYIKNLDDTIDDERLKKEFSKFGDITSAKVMKTDGVSKGFGFVCFSAPDEATKAVTEMNGSIIGTKPLYVALAQRKEERRMHLSNQHAQRIATLRMPQPMQLPFPNGMGPMMSYLPTSIGPSQVRNFYAPAGMQAYRPTPRWSGPTNPGLRPQPNSQMLAGMQMTQSMMNPTQQRTGQMSGIAGRANMSMAGRPTQGMSQMMNNGAVRTQPNIQQRQATYTSVARNLPQPNSIGGIVVPGQEPLTAAALASAGPQEQKQMLGERLFPLIQQIQPDSAGKITGMLLEIDNTELLHMLESRESLMSKVQEAIEVLKAHQNKQMLAAKEAATKSAS